MHFESEDLYHVFNQGNNRQKIFFTRENYLFFLRKINQHILPHADVLARCLIPNHFHLMIHVHTVEVFGGGEAGCEASCSPLSSDPTSSDTHQMTSSHQMSSSDNKSSMGDQNLRRQEKKQDLTQSIAVMLRSYTRAINLQEGRTGSLFKAHTKAECLTTPQGITPAFFNTGFGSQLNVRIPEKEYPQVCFNYIHQNPVKAGLVKNAEDWEFSSYLDYCGIRNGKLINRKRAEEYGLVI